MSRCPERWAELSEAGKPLCVRYEPARLHGHGGGDVAVVWTRGYLNPGERWGRGPGAVWGSLWRGLSASLPDDYVLEVRREPRFKRYGDGERFRGWDWVCPGRMVDGVWRGCGRRSRLLFGPLPVWTVGKGLGVGEGLDVGGAGAGGLGVAGRWHVGEMDGMCGVRSFACRECWGVREPDLRTREGWNDFVMTVSGGLLYGREVRRPSWLGEVVKRGEIRGRRRERRVLEARGRGGVGMMG